MLQMIWHLMQKFLFLHHFKQQSNGSLAQLVEQWTENPCVPGSNPGGTTFKVNHL